MCLSKTPKYTPTEVKQTQDAKQPEQTAVGVSDARKAAASNAGMAGSTLLTGPSGVENSALNLSKKTLLGQ